MIRKKIICSFMVITLALTLAACGKKDGGKNGGNSQDAGNAAEASNQVVVKEEPMVPGTLYQLNQKSGEEILKGVRLDGNIAGVSVAYGETGTGINGRACSTSNVRFAFELNEYVQFYLDATVSSGIKAYFFEHQEDLSAYDNYRESVFEGCAASMQLYKEGEWEWGAECVNPDSHEPGYYDLVFTYEDQPIAKMLVKMYAEGELAGKSDAEIEKLMADEIAAVKK